MAVPTGTFQTFQAIGNREDLSNLIFNISPTETPFVTGVKRTKIKATFHEWQTDELAAAATNAQIQGDDATTNTAVPTVRLRNYSQILVKTPRVSRTQRVVDAAGREDELSNAPYHAGYARPVPAHPGHRSNEAQYRHLPPPVNVFIALIVSFLLYLHVLTILWNLGVRTFRTSSAMLPAMGLLFIFVGVILRQARRNSSIGIRTPWTLSSDRVWNRTHRLGATLFMISGVLAAFGALFPGNIAYWLVLGPVLASSLFLVVYSYFLWREEQAGSPRD